ncbi:MAG: hypothetical protein AB7G23_20425 [Vicinamibacterales bacterium]
MDVTSGEPDALPARAALPSIGLLVCALLVGTALVHLLVPRQPFRYFYGGSCFEDHSPSQVPAIVGLVVGVVAAGVLGRVLLRHAELFILSRRVRGLTLSLLAGCTFGSFGVATFKLSNFPAGIEVCGLEVGTARVWVSCAALGFVFYYPLHEKCAELEARPIRGTDVVQFCLPFIFAPIAAVLVLGWP